MSVAFVAPTYYRPFFQAVIAPVELVYSVFLKAIGCLLSVLGVKTWGDSLDFKANQILHRFEGLFTGLWAYGRRFLVHGCNYPPSCRGSCYWMIREHLLQPQKPLTELAKAFEGRAPTEAIALHEKRPPPKNLQETVVSTERFTDSFPSMPELDPGVYTFLIGFSRDEMTPGVAHRVAFFRGKESYLFDPNTGLSLWSDSDWDPLLREYAKQLQDAKTGFFTLECYRYATVSRPS